MAIGPSAQVEGRISILSVGTRILLKDVMDQYLRTLGDYKTYYASNMASALRLFQENQIHVVISEVDLADGSAYRLIKELGGAGGEDDLYFILALEERSDALLALADEIEADAVLIKPFSSAELRSQMDRYGAWKALPKEPWRLLLQEVRLAILERRYRDAEQNFMDAIASAPNNPAPLTKAGQYYLAKSDPGIAEGFLKRALGARPNHVPALSTLGSLYLSQRDLDRAEEFFKRAQAISPLNPDRNLEIVRLYLERSIETCKAAIRIDPASQPAKIMMAKLMTVQKGYVDAVREFERVLPSLRDKVREEVLTYVALARKLGGIAR